MRGMTSASGKFACAIPLSALVIAAGARYPGSPLVFVFFNVSFIALAALVIPRPRIYAYTCLAGLLLLGFWVKVVVHAIWSPGFVEATGDFSGAPGEWDM